MQPFALRVADRVVHVRMTVRAMVTS